LVVDPKIPSDWLDHVLDSGAGAAKLSFQRHLPADVRRSVSRFARAVKASEMLLGQVQPSI
jgi:hypothetical protein